MYQPFHCHTTSSLLDGLVSPENLAIRAKELGFSSCGITDHGSISGAIKFYKACKERGIKPIIGIEAYFVDNVSVTKGQKSYHICIFAKSDRGLKSLYGLMSNAHKHFYYKPRIDMDMFYDTEDLIVSSACSYGLLAHPNAERVIRQLQEYFEDDFYLEIMPLDFEQQRMANLKALELSQSLGIQIIATGDVHYLKAEDQRLHNFLLNMNTAGRLEFDVSGLYLKDPDEMAWDFTVNCSYLDRKDAEGALENTLAIAEKCNVNLNAKDIVLPKVVAGNSQDELLRRLASAIPNRYPGGFKHRERMEYECSIIFEKGFTDYFLLVHNLVREAKNKGIPLGPGRGSAAGSLICYLLGITDLDPIKEGLMFERFLNPERTDWPDIDLDFSQKKRGLILDYLRETYGEERVAYISTISTLKPKSAFKDVARQLGVPFVVANAISEKIDDTISFSDMVENHPGLEGAVAPVDVGDLVYFTDGLTNVQRHGGTHAAGIVIAPSKIEDFGVLEKRKDAWSINWDMNDVSHQGLVKIDILGLRTLDILAEAEGLIKTRCGVEINWGKINLNTPDILAQFEQGHTIGIFQFESYSMKNLVQQLAPITDKSILVDCNALVRPGPLDSGMTQKYINRHSGKEKTEDNAEPYQPWLMEGAGEDIAGDTYQVIIYQEQVIAVLQKLAGYSIAQADVIRRIFAKKKGDFEEHRKPFLRGCKKTVKMPGDIASVLFDHLETFSRYGFNKSHAAAYTELGLRGMYLKVNYPLEFMAALLIHTPNKEKKVKFIDECQRLKIPVKSVDINKSDADFTIEGDAVRIGLSAVKGVGEKSLSHMMKARKKPFRGISDFRARILRSQLNNGTLRSLILAGCFDSLGENQRLWAEVLIGHTGEGGIAEQPEETVEDYSHEEKEIAKAALLPGIWRMDIKPEIGLNIDRQALEEMREFIGACRECSLRKIYDSPTPFEFYDDSSILCVAEAPGEMELRQGRPLIGKAGDTLIVDTLYPLGIKRRELFLTNVYKCRPLDNRLPPDVSHNCWEILGREIEILQPKLIVAFGNTAREFFTGQSTGINAAADKLTCEVEIVAGRPIPILYSVHPASVLHQNGEANRKRLKASMEVLQKIKLGLYEEEVGHEEE